MKPTIGFPPPEPEGCLVRSRVSRYKGGTLIDEDVRDRAAHARRICDPDGYRPGRCPRCEHTALHVHSYPERVLRGEVGTAVVKIIQYSCAKPQCGATWRVLPLFLARHLWWAWSTIERTVKPQATPTSRDATPIPERTARRWKARLATSARLLVLLLAARAGHQLAELTVESCSEMTRGELVETYALHSGASPGQRLAAVASLTHRLDRGVRLM